MEAPHTLSQEQKTCLEGVFTFLQGATVYLQAVEHVAYPEDAGHLKGLLDLGALCLSRLSDYFPDVAEFKRGVQASRERERRMGGGQ